MTTTNSHIPDINQPTREQRRKADRAQPTKQNTNSSKENGDILDDLEELRTFTGPPAEFWMEFMRVCTLLTDSDAGLLLIRDESDEKWKTLCLWPSGNQAAVRKSGVRSAINQVADLCLRVFVLPEQPVLLVGQVL